MSFAITAECEGDIHSMTVIADRDEAHRVLTDAQRLDDEIVTRALEPMYPMRFRLVNVDDLATFFNTIAREAPDRERPA